MTKAETTAGRFARAVAVSVQISWGSQGVSEIAVPAGKFSCRSCSACGSAWVGPSSPVLRPAWPQTSTTGLYASPETDSRACAPMACRRAAMWPSGAMKAPYDEPTPTLWPKAEIPERMPDMPSSQMPPVESRRASGLVAALKKPSGKPSATVLTLVEPSRSAEADRKAPPEARLRWLSARASSWRSVVDEPGVRRSSPGMPAASRRAASYAATTSGAPGRGARLRRSRRWRAADRRPASASATAE